MISLDLVIRYFGIGALALVIFFVIAYFKKRFDELVQKTIKRFKKQ